MSNQTTANTKSRRTAPLFERKYVSFRLTTHTIRLIDAIVKRRAINRTRAVEWAIQEVAERDGVTKGGSIES